MKLAEWVASQGGASVVARRLGVERHRVDRWLQGAAAPRLVILQRLVKLARGRLSYDGVISETERLKVNAERRRARRALAKAGAR